MASPIDGLERKGRVLGDSDFCLYMGSLVHRGVARVNHLIDRVELNHEMVVGVILDLLRGLQDEQFVICGPYRLLRLPQLAIMITHLECKMFYTNNVPLNLLAKSKLLFFRTRTIMYLFLGALVVIRDFDRDLASRTCLFLMEFIDSVHYYQEVVPLLRRILDLGLGNSNTSTIIEGGNFLQKYSNVRFGGSFYWSQDEGHHVHLMNVCHEFAQRVKLEVFILFRK